MCKGRFQHEVDHFVLKVSSFWYFEILNKSCRLNKDHVENIMSWTFVLYYTKIFKSDLRSFFFVKKILETLQHRLNKLWLWIIVCTDLRRKIWKIDDWISYEKVYQDIKAHFSSNKWEYSMQIFIPWKYLNLHLNLPA